MGEFSEAAEGDCLKYINSYLNIFFIECKKCV